MLITNKILLGTALIGLLSLPFYASAQMLYPPAEGATNPSPISASQERQVIDRLKQSRPDLDFSNLRPSELPSLYKVDINGRLAFVSTDGSFLLSGEMYQVGADGLINLQEREREQAERAFRPERAKLMAAVDQKEMVIFSPEKEPKGHIYVFTDIDCGYCRQLHRQMDAYLDKGIEVRYLAFPRAGVGSNSAKKLETTWCAEDPQAMMTRYKLGENVPTDSCEGAPVATQLALGQQVGVNATPAIVLESGELILGARSPDDLAKQMGL